jgi:hypothetical protein
LANDLDDLTPRPKPRWFQFRLRTLFVFIGVCAVGLGLGYRMNRAQRQRAAVDAIGHFGQVRYDTPASEEDDVFYRRWLRRWLPQDYVDNVTIVYLRKGDDADLGQLIGHLGALPGLKRLEFVNTFKLTDAGLKHLHALRWLEEINLWLRNRRRGRKARPLITDEGVAELQKALPNCKIIR